MKEAIKKRLKSVKNNPDSAVAGASLRKMADLYHFHSVGRFSNALKVKRMIKSGAWTEFSFGRSMIQRIFHVCAETGPQGKTVVKLPRGDNLHSCNFIESLSTSESLAEYKRSITEVAGDPDLGKHCPEVLEISKDGGYKSEYIEGYNVAQMRDELFDLAKFANDDIEKFVKALEDLLVSLHGYAEKQGYLIGDWPLHNLIYSPERSVIFNVDLEGFYSFRKPGVENNLELIEAEFRDMIDFLRLRESNDLDDRNIVSALTVLDEVRRSGESYSGQKFLVGYHSLKLKNRIFRGQRECSERLASIPFDFSKKVVVDLGCNCGGMLQTLAPDIERGYGFDFNPKCINAAKAVSMLNEADNLEFFNFDLDHDNLAMIPSLLLNQKVDICFLLSVCMWLENWKPVVRTAAKLAPNVLFESNGSAEEQDQQYNLLIECFESVSLIEGGSEDDPLQSERKLYLCEKSRLCSALMHR